LTVRPNTARSVDNKTRKKRFVKRSLNLKHYAAASKRNAQLRYTQALGLLNMATRNVASACMTSLETYVYVLFTYICSGCVLFTYSSAYSSSTNDINIYRPFPY